jgi:hypothetical protein
MNKEITPQPSNIPDLEVLLWSKKSNTFHIEKLTQTIKHGQQSFAADTPPDYVIVGVAPDLDGIRQIRCALTDARPNWDEQ